MNIDNGVKTDQMTAEAVACFTDPLSLNLPEIGVS